MATTRTFVMRKALRRLRQTVDAPASSGAGEMVPDYVATLVSSMDLAPEAGREGGDYIHASALIGLCIRAQALAHRLGGLRRTPDSAQRLVWALGRAAEKHVRTQFIAAVDAAGVVGSWRCPCGEAVRDGLRGDPPAVCAQCRKPADEYSELVLVDHEARIIGSPDMLFRRPDDGRLRVVEIKSMNRKDFELLSAPLPDHVLQAAIYRRLLAENHPETDEEVSVMYVCKDWTRRPYREFSVDSQAPKTLEWLDAAWERAREYQRWRAGDLAGQRALPLPQRLPQCTEVAAPAAKKCACGTPCFARGS
jgi:hypothetical protein